MFSGKTTELIRRIKRYEVANHKCLIIKYANDMRYEQECGAGVATHDHHTKTAVAATKLSATIQFAETCSVIGIDEGQFFADIIEFSEMMANAGKIVVVAALDGTYQRSGFGNILNLVPLAEHVIKLTAVCMRCYGEAAYTQRLGSETAVEVIGGTEKYMAVCRECYRKSDTDDCCHGNRMSSPLNQLRAPLKVNNNSGDSPTASKMLFGKENAKLMIQ